MVLKITLSIITCSFKQLYPSQHLPLQLNKELTEVFEKLSLILYFPLIIASLGFGLSSVFRYGKPFWLLSNAQQLTWYQVWKQKKIFAPIFRFYENVIILVIEK